VSEVRELYVITDDEPRAAEMMMPDGVTWPNMVRTLHEMRNEMHAYASQLMALQLQMAVIKARLDAWEGD